MRRDKHKDRPDDAVRPDNPPAERNVSSPQQEAGGQPTAADEVGRLRVERDDLLARLQRVSADFLNYQKRVQKDVQEARDFANAELMTSLLGVLDDMERVLEAAKANHSGDDPLLVGARLVYDKTAATLATFGLEAIQAVGEHFDPHRHLALVHQPSDEHSPGTVLAELQKGYQLKGRIIRPASVVVSKGPERQPDAPPAGDEEE